MMIKKEKGIGPEIVNKEKGKEMKCPHCNKKIKPDKIFTKGKCGTIFIEWVCSNPDCQRVIAFNGVDSTPKEAS